MSTVLPLPIQRTFALIVTLALMLAAMVPLVAPAATRASSHVWINEIHYDNDGTDAGEAVEVAGEAGTDLSGWTIVLYNGSTGAVYDTDPLSGTLIDQQGGFGTAVVTYPANGIQNGAPDGLALVDDAGAVVQFLSYEGQFSAVGGPADGLVSTPITQSEGGTTAVGHSLQLVGSGTAYANFSWEVPQPNTLGAVNTGQTLGDGTTPISAVINEFSASTAGTDVEFVEVLGPASTDLSSLTILEIEGESTGWGTIDEVIDVGTTDANGRWHTDLAANALENGTLTLLLVSGFSGAAGTDLDTNNDGTLDATPWTQVLDAVAVHDGGAGELTYGTPVLGPNYDGVSDFAPGGASRIPDGTDTDTVGDWVRNDFDLAGIAGFTGTPVVGEALNTPGAANEAVEAPIPAGVTISQVYGGGGNAGATLTNDFIELFNTTTEPIDLTGWSVQYASASGSTWQATELTGTIAPGGYYLIQEAAGTGGTTLLPLPDATGDIAMAAQNGKVALAPTPDLLTGTCPLEETVDFVGYGSANCFEGTAAAPVLSNTTAAIRDDGGATDTDDNAADFAAGAPSPRNSTGTGPIDPCTMDVTLISAIQGSGLTSPLVGETVAIRGVVVGDFQSDPQTDDSELGGFNVQEENDDADTDPLTSEGIFVFRSSPDVAVGDLVAVIGTVVEFGSSGSLTELTDVRSVFICDEGVDLPTPAQASLPVTDPADFERWEGMRVTFEQTLTISEFFNYDRFGEIALTVDRDFQPTAVYEPNSPEADALAEENRLNRITLDDGLTNQNPDFTRHPNGDAFTLENRFRGGDTLTNVTGVIDHSFGLYRVQPTEGADYTAVNLRPETPEDVGGSLTAASFNVLNYFTTLDDGENDICGPAEDQECRGADSAEELARQQAKIVAALAAIDADVVGLIEIENHPADVPTATLVDALNAEVGAGTYDYIATGAIGTDAIRVAMIYKPASVTPVGDFAILDSSVDDRFDDDANRPVLAQAFEENATGGVFTMAVNHLKSKGSDCGGPPDDDPVQGNCNLTRTLAAEALVDWLATDPTGSGDLDALIIGDLNAYDKEDPIDAIRAAGYTDLVHEFQGEFAYSYLFDGQLGYLDTALANPTLSSQVTGATVWHINADEPDLIDYDTSFKSDAQDALYAPDPYRSSDHDPVIVGLDLAAFGFGGLEPPIDEDNTARAGSAVPVKFSLDGDLGLDVLFEPLQVYDCGGWPAGASVDADSTGNTGLRYDPADDQYVFTWKTDRTWAGDCKTLVLTLDDGSYATASFEFR